MILKLFSYKTTAWMLMSTDFSSIQLLLIIFEYLE